MELLEIKITQNQYDIINKFRYDLKKKQDYIIKEIITNRYEFSQDTAFITYQDSRNYYLVFEGTKIDTGKIPPSSWCRSQKLKEN